MKQLAIAALGVLVAMPALAADSYTLDTRHTFPSWSVSHMGFSTQRGRFDKTSGKIVLDRAAKTGSVDITIDANSVDTGLEELHKHLRGENFFDTAKYPTITFKSTKVNFNGDVPASVDGQVTLLGVTKPLTLTIANFKCGTHPVNKKDLCGADATGVIKRSEHGMTKYVPGISDDVKLEIQIEAFKD